MKLDLDKIIKEFFVGKKFINSKYCNESTLVSIKGKTISKAYIGDHPTFEGSCFYLCFEGLGKYPFIIYDDFTLEEEVKKEKFPISKYVGIYPYGHWVFVKEFEGTYEESLDETKKLRDTDPYKLKYNIWGMD
jgi:hypothetical protein